VNDCATCGIRSPKVRYTTPRQCRACWLIQLRLEREHWQRVAKVICDWIDRRPR